MARQYLLNRAMGARTLDIASTTTPSRPSTVTNSRAVRLEASESSTRRPATDLIPARPPWRPCPP